MFSAFSLSGKRERLARENSAKVSTHFGCTPRAIYSPLEPPEGKTIEVTGLRPGRLSLRRSSNDSSAPHILFRAARRFGFTCFIV